MKCWESIKEKLGRVKLSIESITDLQDLVGVRLIFPFSREVSIVEGLIPKLYKIIRQYDTLENLDQDQFGYLSKHFIVQLAPEQISPIGIHPNLSLKAEIQVRTIAQHLWAEASHILQYKQESSIPSDISRDISRVSALLETVDNEFEKVLAKRDEYRSGVVKLNTDSQLNVDLLEKTLDLLWPSENKRETEKYEFLLSQLKHDGIYTQRQLVSLIQSHRDDVLRRSAREAEYHRNIYNTHPIENGTIKIRTKNKSHTITGITPELIKRVEKGIFYGHVALTITALQFEFGERDPNEPFD